MRQQTFFLMTRKAKGLVPQDDRGNITLFMNRDELMIAINATALRCKKFIRHEILAKRQGIQTDNKYTQKMAQHHTDGKNFFTPPFGNSRDRNNLCSEPMKA